MQVLGGYGYIEEYGMAQYLRDARITMIYEGTNGVQAMDLVGRKLPKGMGQYLKAFFHRVDKFIEENKANKDMAEFTKPLAAHMKYLQQASLWIAQNGMTNPNQAGAGAVEYTRMFALVTLAWLWAKQAKIALTKLDSDKEFYGTKIATARFYFAKLLPYTISLLSSITNGSDSVMAEGL
jgi:hypothetical protein